MSQRALRVYFLGTGPSRPIPRSGCRCRLCRTARGKKSKSQRCRSAILFEMRGQRLLFNAPPEICEELKRAGSPRADYVFISHKHRDAFGGISALKKCSPESAIYFEPKNLYHGAKINASGIIVLAFRVGHSMTPGFPTLGFRIGKKLAYVSDASKIPKKSEKYIKGLQNLILDASMWFGTQIKSHFTVDKAIKIADMLGVGRVYLQQISHTYPPHEEAARGIRDFCRKNRIKTKVILAYDGLKIRV